MTVACNNEITVQNNYYEYYISFIDNMERQRKLTIFTNKAKSI